MINVFFDTWPEILFWTGKTDTVIDPLLETVIWMIYNTGPSTSLTDMKVCLIALQGSEALQIVISVKLKIYNNHAKLYILGPRVKT